MGAAVAGGGGWCLLPEGGGLILSTKPFEFIEFGAMDVTKPYEFIKLGAMDVTKPCEFKQTLTSGPGGPVTKKTQPRSVPWRPDGGRVCLLWSSGAPVEELFTGARVQLLVFRIHWVTGERQASNNLFRFSYRSMIGQRGTQVGPLKVLTAACGARRHRTSFNCLSKRTPAAATTICTFLT